MAPPSWVILSREATASADLPQGADLSLLLAAPPKVTTVAVRSTICPLLSDPTASPCVLAADPSGLLLLLLTPPPISERNDGELLTWRGPDGVDRYIRLVVCDVASCSADKPIRDTDGRIGPDGVDSPFFVVICDGSSSSSDDDEPAPYTDGRIGPDGVDSPFFVVVCDGSSSSSDDEPAPYTDFRICNSNLGVITAPGGGGHYMVVEFQHKVGDKDASLLCYSSEKGDWVKKHVSNPRPGCEWAFSHVVSHGGKVWWVDPMAGLLGLDPFADEPHMEYVQLPQGGHGCGCCSERELRSRRLMQLSDGVFCCVEMSCASHGAPKLSMIVLADPATSEWTPEYEVSFTEIWASDTYKAAGLPEKAPELALLHPTSPNTVYFFLEGRLFGVDMRKRVVVGCEPFEHARPENKSRVSNWLVFPFELPPASGLTPCWLSRELQSQDHVRVAVGNMTPNTQGGGLVVWSFVAVHVPQQLIWRIQEQLIRLHELSQDEGLRYTVGAQLIQFASVLSRFNNGLNEASEQINLSFPYLELLERTVGEGQIAVALNKLAQLLRTVCEMLGRASTGITIAAGGLRVLGSRLQRRRLPQRSATATDTILVRDVAHAYEIINEWIDDGVIVKVDVDAAMGRDQAMEIFRVFQESCAFDLIRDAEVLSTKVQDVELPEWTVVL